MPPARWLPAAGFGALNTAVFLLASGSYGTIILFGAPWLVAILLALCILAAWWCLEAVDDLRRMSARDAAAMLVRGSMAGALVGAIVGAIAFGIDDVGNSLFGGMLTGFLGLFAGLVCAILDAAILAGLRIFVPPRA